MYYQHFAILFSKIGYAIHIKDTIRRDTGITSADAMGYSTKSSGMQEGGYFKMRKQPGELCPTSTRRV